jgi:hypothetical protein
MSPRTLVPCLLVLTGLGPQARADLTCPAPVHQAGAQHSGKTLLHQFSLLNQGAQPVEVTQVKPGCGCLKARIDRKSFAPGATGQVTVEINTITQPAGANSWKVTLQGTQAGVPFEFPLVVQAQLTAELSIQPATVILHTDSVISHTFTLTESRPAPVTIHAGTTGSQHIRVRVAQAEGKPGQWQRNIFLEVMPTCPDGRYEDVLVLYTRDVDYPELRVPFTVVKRSPSGVRASPETVEWLAQGDQPLPARIVLLGAGSDQPVEVAKVEPSHPCLHCTWAEGPGTRATLRISVERGEMSAGGFEGTVRVHITHPTPQVVTVPVRCVAR